MGCGAWVTNGVVENNTALGGEHGFLKDPLCFIQHEGELCIGIQLVLVLAVLCIPRACVCGVCAGVLYMLGLTMSGLGTVNCDCVVAMVYVTIQDG